MSQEEIMKRLREPFTSKEIEWKVQVTTQDKTRGMVVAYIDARALQKRLDDVAGAFNWRNEYAMWQEKSQICGLSIYCAERREWITKYDGAENSDYEPIKGGLSDAFKRAAIMWGIGRYPYEIEGIWCDIEAKGKSFAIKQDQYTKLEADYNAAVAKIFGDTSNSHPPSVPKTELQPHTSDNIYKVHSIKPSGKSSQLLELVDNNGEVITAYVKNSDTAITAGACLQKVAIEKKTSSYGAYNLVIGYELIRAA